MKRVAKPEGKFNVIIEDAPMPEPGPGEVRVKAVRSLISRGSEMGGRYTREYAVNPESMGYSLAGIVDAVGDGVEHYAVGDRVVASAPHAQYTVRPRPFEFTPGPSTSGPHAALSKFRPSPLLSANLGCCVLDRH